MGLIGWLKTQLRDDELEGLPDTEAAEPRGGEAPAFPEFEGVLCTQLVTDVQTFIASLADADDQAFGHLLIRALESDDIEPPAMPDDVVRIQRLLAEPDCDVAPLARAICRDPAIAGRFVGIANSPLYARADRVRSVDEAVIRIGMKQTSMIVMAIVSKTKLFRAPGFEKEAQALHRHCLAGAVCGQLMARRVGVFEGHAFMGGLLQDIGRIWMMSMASDLTRSSRGKKKANGPTLAAMSDRFHAGFSARVTESWGFEDALVAAIMFHHAPSAPTADYTPDMIPPDATDLTYVLAAGELMGHSLLNPDQLPSHALADICETLELEFNPELRTACWNAFHEFEQLLS